MDTRTDPGQYYPGGRIMVRPDVAPDQGRVIRWGDIQGKPDFSDVAALVAADSLGKVKETMNTVVNKMKTSMLILFAVGSALADVAPLYTTPNVMPGDAPIMTNTQAYIDAKVAGVPAAGNYAAVSNAAMNAATRSDLVAATNAALSSLSSLVSLVARDATNYTDSATAAKASTNDVQLTPVYSQTPTFSDWVIKRDGVDVTSHVAGQPVYEDHNGAMDWNVERCFYGDDTGYSEDDVFIPGTTAAETLLSWRGIFPPDYDTAVYYTATRIRTDVIGYTLGAQTDKVLASTNLESGVSAAVVTNIVHDLSLGGIWDSALEVWWTPRMVNGSLTYHATTNVNLNAGN